MRSGRLVAAEHHRRLQVVAVTQRLRSGGRWIGRWLWERWLAVTVAVRWVGGWLRRRWLTVIAPVRWVHRLRPRWLVLTATGSVALIAATLVVWAVHAHGRPYDEAAAGLAVAVTASGVLAGTVTLFTAAYHLWRTVTPPELEVFLLPRDVAAFRIFWADGQFPQFMVPSLGLRNVGPGSIRVNRVTMSASFLYASSWRDERVRGALGRVVPGTFPMPFVQLSDTNAREPWAQWVELPDNQWEKNRWELTRPYTIEESPPISILSLSAQPTTLSGELAQKVEEAIDQKGFVFAVVIEIDADHRLIQRVLHAPVQNLRHTADSG